MKGVTTFLILAFTTVVSGKLSNDEEQAIRILGESKFREVIKKSEGNPCWKRAVARLNSTCKGLTDIQQSKLAVAFANCHLMKSGRRTYVCDDSMSVETCTGDMDPVAFQTYTEFFTHTGHICYFLQNILWQEKTENIIFELSETSSETVKKLKQSLEHHQEIEKKQNEVLLSFVTMEEMATKQRDLLWEVYSSLKGSVDSIRYVMSLFLIELVGIETFVVTIVIWVVILLLPKVNYSRFWLMMVLICEQLAEIVVRKAYGKLVRDTDHPSPDHVNALYGWIWFCRYVGLCVGVSLYLWRWCIQSNPVQRNLLMLQEIREDIDSLNKRVSGALLRKKGENVRQGYGPWLGMYSKAFSRYSEPPLSPISRWRVENYLKSLPDSMMMLQDEDKEGRLTLSIIPETAGSIKDTSTMSHAPSFHTSDHGDDHSIFEEFTPVRPISPKGTKKSTLATIKEIVQEPNNDTESISHPEREKEISEEKEPAHVARYVAHASKPPKNPPRVQKYNFRSSFVTDPGSSSVEASDMVTAEEKNKASQANSTFSVKSHHYALRSNPTARYDLRSL